jgi:hypothetical protein
VAILIKIEDSETWKIWIVPPIKSKKEEFFLELSKIFSANRDGLRNLDIGMVEYRSIADRTIELFGAMFRFGGIGSAYLNNVTVNGVLLPEAIAIRIEL